LSSIEHETLRQFVRIVEALKERGIESLFGAVL